MTDDEIVRATRSTIFRRVDGKIAVVVPLIMGTWRLCVSDENTPDTVDQAF